MPDNTAANAASARIALPTLRRTLDQYANCTPAAVSGGSQAQMYFFVEDAKHDIAALVEALRSERERCAQAVYDCPPFDPRTGLFCRKVDAVAAIRAGGA